MLTLMFALSQISIAPDQIITLINASIVLAIVGLAIVLYVGSHRSQAEHEDKTSMSMDELREIHRRRRFLARYPEWEGRDFIADPSSPWHVEA